MADNAELQTYKFEREKKHELDQPISLWFEEHAIQPVSAQLAFTITFGEYAKNDTLDIEYGIQNATDLEIVITKAEHDLIIFNTTTNGTEDRYISHVVDLKNFLENLNETDIDAESFDYFGEYIIRINDTEAGCLLEQFEIEVAKYLDPNDPDFDDDGILDGIETSMLVEGTDLIDFKDIYWYEERNYEQPQGWWTMDDETKGAGVAEDWSKNDNDGLLTNMEVSDWIAGKIGPYALIFDGSNEYVDCGAILEDSNEGAFGDNSQQFMITAWINASDISNSAQSNHGTKNCFIAKASDSTNDNFEFGVNNDGTLHVYLDTESHDTQANLGNSGDITENIWHFVAVTYNYGNLSVRIDNETYTSTAWQGGSTDLDAALGAKFTIGGTLDSGVYFNGSIDDVRVYNTCLDDANIEWIYNNGTGQSLKPINSGAVLTTTNGSGAYNEFTLEIPQIGEVYDANLSFKIDSEETPWGTGTVIGSVDVELIKDEINCSIADMVLIDESFNIYDGWDFSQSFNLNLSGYVANGTISEFYGNYILRIEITDDDFYETYNFTLSEFCIETDTWVQAEDLGDTTAWVTDPAKDDTDGDGWNDYYEIYVKGTNPCSTDTDSDGVWDSSDIDPFKNLLIEVKFVSGRHRNLCYWQSDPDLEALVEFELKGVELGYITELRKATCDPVDDDLYLFEPNQKAYFGHKYYLDVPDDESTLKFRFELWQISPTAEDGSRLGDVRLVKEDYTYAIVGESNVKYKTFDDEGDFGKDNELEVRITTLAIEKANTIAIYEANTSFSGHYSEQEHTNVIQLWVTDDGADTPFEKGPNAIVISTSLFGNTKLHSMLEKEQLEQTPLWSPISGDYQFIAVDRDENAHSNGATNQVDFVIIRQAISSTQAMQVLDLLLTCYVNESIDELTNMTIYEEAKLYTYVSTKLNGTNAEKLNLHTDVLDYIPYFCDYKNSPQGQEPNSKNDLSAEYILTVTGYVALIVGAVVLAIVSWGTCTMLSITLICFAVMMLFMLDAYLPGIADILNTLQAFIVNLGMSLLTWLGPLGWAILRAVILVLIWAQFGFMLFLITLLFGAIIEVIHTLSEFIDLEDNNSENEINVEGEIELSVGFKTEKVFNSFLDCDIPQITTYLESLDFAFKITSNFFSENLIFTKFSNDIFGGLNITIPENSSDIENASDLISGIGFAMGLAGGVVGSLAGILTFTRDEKIKKAIFVAGFLFFAGSIAVLLYKIFLTTESLSPWTIMGTGIGFLISGAMFILTSIYIEFQWDFMAFLLNNIGLRKLMAILALIDFIGQMIGFYLNLREFLGFVEDNSIYKLGTAISTLGFGIASLILACKALVLLGGQDEKSRNYYNLNRQDKAQIANVFGGISLVLGIGLTFIGVEDLKKK